MASSRAILLFLSFFVFTTVDLLKSSSWGDRPLFPHTQIPEDGLSPRRALVRRKIVLYHNFFRTKVRPTASNMLLMSWHPEAARLAQRYADKCVFLQHNDINENAVPQLGNCGQNLFVSSQRTPWFFALKTWFLEYKNFTYGRPAANFKDIGHYTQMVWATSHKVGCGVTYCKGGPWGHFYNYVCHYCPGGNVGTHYFHPYKIGTPCADCPNDCVSGSLCANTCSHRDMYSNCKMLTSLNLGEDFCDRGMCNATCRCGNSKIYKNYPWI